MEKQRIKAVILTVGIAITLIAGCSEQELPDVKKSRLIATENRQLKKELDLRSEEIESQRGLLEKCQDEKKAIEENLHKGSQELIDLLFTDTEKTKN